MDLFGVMFSARVLYLSACGPGVLKKCMESSKIGHDGYFTDT